MGLTGDRDLLLAVLSTVLALSSVLGTFLIARGRRWGWLFMVLFQVPCGAYDVWTSQYGFLLISALGGWAYWTGYTHREVR